MCNIIFVQIHVQILDENKKQEPVYPCPEKLEIVLKLGHGDLEWEASKSYIWEPEGNTRSRFPQY